MVPPLSCKFIEDKDAMRIACKQSDQG